MNNDQAGEALEARQTAIHLARNAMRRYLEETAASRWSNTVKSAQIVAIKAAALEAGVDISGWRGEPAA